MRRKSLLQAPQALTPVPHQPPRHDPIPHRLSLRLFLRWGLDWPLCGDEMSFFRSLVGEGGPVPLPILGGGRNKVSLRASPEPLLPCPSQKG